MLTVQLQFKPVSEQEKFGKKIYDLLVENFSQTFFVGGMVRDMLLKKTITDIDIATAAQPKLIVKALQQNGIKYDENNSKFGVVTALAGGSVIEIATFRLDIYKNNRYPKVKYIESPKKDSLRRDFTINSLYFKPETGEVIDFHHGIADIKARLVRFIGVPSTRIKEDPLRVVRALRFCATLDMKLEEKTKSAIKKHFVSVHALTQTRLGNELNKIKNERIKKIILKILDSPDTLDNIF